MTPSIQIGTVTQGSSFNVTRTGTNENPILNFTLVKGDKGDVGSQGPVGPTGNGISSIRKTGTDGLVDTYTITYTNGNTTTFTVANGEDGEVTETELDVLRQNDTELKNDISKNADEITNLKNENAYLQKVVKQAFTETPASGTELTINNTIEARMDLKLKGNTSQQQYNGINLLNNDIDNTTQNGITIQHDDNSVTINGTNTGSGFKRDFKNNITFKANTNYTVYIKVISGNFKPYNSNSDWAALFYIENNRIMINNKSSNFIMNFTPTEDIEVLPYFWFGWDRNSVQGQSSIFNNFKLQIMIVEGNYTSSTIPSYEPYVGGTASPNPDYPQEIQVVTGDNTITISNSDNTEKQELPISLGSLELCKIGDYQDYIYKNNGKWYKHKVIDKVQLLSSFGWKQYVGINYFTMSKRKYIAQSNLPCNCFNKVTCSLAGNDDNPKNNINIYDYQKDNSSTITLDELKTILDTKDVYVYLGLITPIEEEITDTTLITQLNELSQALSKKGTTIISQNNDDLQFNLDVIALTK